MRDIERLAQSEWVSEWINPCDKKLVTVTGQPAPNNGVLLREKWDVTKDEESQLLEEVQRLLLPKQIVSNVVSKGTAIFDLADSSAFTRGFPLDKWTNIIDYEEDSCVRKAWAAIGLCGQVVGLAVFVAEYSESISEADIAHCEICVQKLPDDKLEALIELEM